MAGRGTDIVLGKGVAELGGLHIIGTERHESRRIDNQLRGRSGRQGDMGSSRFYMSLEDDLMRIFAAERISKLMKTVGMEEDEPIEHNLVSKAIENAQKRVEGQNFNIRKQLLDFDDVMNVQREVIYKQRREALESTDLRQAVMDMIEDMVSQIVEAYTDEKTLPEDWGLEEIQKEVLRIFDIQMNTRTIIDEDMDQAGFQEWLTDVAKAKYEQREQEMGEDIMRDLERFLTLQMVDMHWKEHLVSMDYLKEGIGLRGYGQVDPLVEYKREGHEMFHAMIDKIKEEIVQGLFHILVQREDEREQMRREQEQQPMYFSHGDGSPSDNRTVRKGKKIGRNEPCPCGSGKKYKKCCGR